MPTPVPTPASIEPEEQDQDPEPDANEVTDVDGNSPPPPAPPEGRTPKETGSNAPPALPDLTERDALITENGGAPIQEIVEVEIKGDQVPRIGFGNVGFPLFAPTGQSAWALLNLVLTVLGIIYIVVTTIRVITQKKRKQEEAQDEYLFRDVNEEEKLPEEDEEKQHRPGWLAVAIAMAIMAVYIFILTQDMTNPMVLMDKWTTLHALIIAAQFIAVTLVFKRQNRDEREDELDKLLVENMKLCRIRMENLKKENEEDLASEENGKWKMENGKLDTASPPDPNS